MTATVTRLYPIGAKPDDLPHRDLMRRQFRRDALDMGSTYAEADEYAERELARLDGDDAA